MANILTPEDVQWKYNKHITMTDHSHYEYRDNQFGISKEVLTKRDGHGWSGSSKIYYFIDDCEREFTDLQILCDCWNEIKNFDDPHNEIVWEKKIVKTLKQKQ